MLDDRFEIVSIRLDPSYTRATAIVRGRQRVRPYRRNGKPSGRAVEAERAGARTSSDASGGTNRFVVWRVELLRLSRAALGAFARGLRVARARASAAADTEADLAAAESSSAHYSQQIDRAERAIGALDRGRAQPSPGARRSPLAARSPASSGSRRREARSTICPTTTLIRALAADSALAQNPQPFGPGSFWYPVGPGRVCIYAPNSVLPCYTLVGAGGAPGGPGLDPGAIAASVADRLPLLPGRIADVASP